MHVVHELIASLRGRALLSRPLLAVALVAFAAVAVQVATSASGPFDTPSVNAAEDNVTAEPTKKPDGDEKKLTKTPEDEKKPTKTPEDEKPTKTPKATDTATPAPTDTPTSVPTNTPANTATNTPVNTATATNTPVQPSEAPPTATPTEAPVLPQLPNSGSGMLSDALTLSWYWYALVIGLMALGVGVLIKPSYD